MAQSRSVVALALQYAGVAAVLAGAVLLPSARGTALALMGTGVAVVVVSTFVRPRRAAD